MALAQACGVPGLTLRFTQEAQRSPRVALGGPGKSYCLGARHWSCIIGVRISLGYGVVAGGSGIGGDRWEKRGLCGQQRWRASTEPRILAGVLGKRERHMQVRLGRNTANVTSAAALHLQKDNIRVTQWKALLVQMKDQLEETILTLTISNNC